MSNRPSPVGRFFSELQRRRVLRTAALYIVGTWLALQVADVLFPALDIPEQSIRYLLYVGILGFPLALIFGWFFDLGTDGLHRTGPPADGELRTLQPLAGKDYALLGALVVVLGAIVYGTLTQVEIEPTREAAQPPVSRDGPPMIAVMPFANLSTEENGELFARGVHDDLLTQLSQLGSVRVISRTSVLNYAGTTKKIPEIGQELGADAVVEAGIQIVGEQMRINAQLIDAQTDEHLWAETYDRALTASNIFRVQADIARAIATALAATISQAEAAELDVIPTENMAAYRAFHEAMRFAEQNHMDSKVNRPKYEAGLRKAIELDPNFTAPMVELVGSLGLASFSREDPEKIEQAEALIERIGQIKPDSVDLLKAQSYYTYYILKDYDSAWRLIGQARARNPSNVRLVDLQGWIARRDRNYEAWLESARLAFELEPSQPLRAQTLLSRLMMMHRYEEARSFSQTRNDFGVWGSISLAMLQFPEHRDVQRYRDDVAAALQDPENGRFYFYSALWEANLMVGDYEAASQVINELNDPYRYQGETQNQLSMTKALELIQSILMDDPVQRSNHAAEARVQLGLAAREQADTDVPDRVDHDSLALILMAEGAFEQAERALQQELREMSKDPARMIGGRSNICKGLGMGGAAAKAVECMRAGFREPSTMMPFFEPYLPYYDRIRDTAPFQTLMGELQAEGWSVPQE